ncbi:MAG TPA: ester cyclase [Caulobacteraceae bacterium]
MAPWARSGSVLTASSLTCARCAALADYRCTVEDLIEGEGRAAARARFEGVHRGDLLGFAPTGRHVAWTGAAIFTVAAGRLADVWVLGDLDSLRRQLAERD